MLINKEIGIGLDFGASTAAGELKIGLIDCWGWGEEVVSGNTFINKDDAIKIIEHLKQVFELEDKHE